LVERAIRALLYPTVTVLVVCAMGNMATIVLKVNGQTEKVEVDPSTPLLYVLSDELHLRGPKFGCGLAQCGACTVLVSGHSRRSCVMPVNAVGTQEIITLEGLGTPEKPHPIQQAFIEEQAAQCGFCLSGVILTAKALLDENPKASDEEIRESLSGVLCRCFVHTRMLRAIRRYQASLTERTPT
jgi:nicotinate dehydrogenase subunit A